MGFSPIWGSDENRKPMTMKLSTVRSEPHFGCFQDVFISGSASRSGKSNIEIHFREDGLWHADGIGVVARSLEAPRPLYRVASRNIPPLHDLIRFCH
jgi:hypothetical protein